MEQQTSIFDKDPTQMTPTFIQNFKLVHTYFPWRWLIWHPLWLLPGLKHGPIDAPPSPTPGLSRVHQGKAKKALKAISCHLPQVTPSVHFACDKPGSLFRPFVDFSSCINFLGVLRCAHLLPNLAWSVVTPLSQLCCQIPIGEQSWIIHHDILCLH